VSGTTLYFESTGYGSNAFVDINTISGSQSFSASRDTGTDIVAAVNGITAQGDGNTLSINTATLALKATVPDGSSGSFSFRISGGGALFQLGPDVVSNQQARIGIQSMSTASLGGTSGRLYQLASGQSASVENDATTAGEIVDQVLTKVTSLRGRLGAFQKSSLESNTVTLNDTLENLTAAESAIRDADFAAESAALTRAQILVQSGTAVLAIANSNPQNVLALLR
jgi:flagellin